MLNLVNVYIVGVINCFLVTEVERLEELDVMHTSLKNMYFLQVSSQLKLIKNNMISLLMYYNHIVL
jgi:hypothetical protein